MRIEIPVVLLILAMMLAGSAVSAAETNDPAADLQSLMQKIKADISAGKTTEFQLSDDLKQFDVLLSKYKGQKTDAVAEIVFMKATLYSEVFDDQPKAAALMKQLKTEFQGTHLVAALEQEDVADAAAKKIRAGLVPGTRFPGFNVQDLDGKPLSLADHRGKVVLIDFCDTGNPSCQAAIPALTTVYKKYHGRGFDIISVDLDEDRQKVAGFVKANNVTWPQVFDGQDADNRLASKYGVRDVPSNFLLDTNGVIIAQDLYGSDLAKAVARTLPK